MKQKRWYHIDPDSGKKVIRSFDVGVNPGDPWLPGMGPHTPEAYAKTVENNRKHFLGKPKPPEQREKMRQAKLGKRFTEEHCERLTQAHEQRRVAKRERNLEAMRIAMSTVMGDSNSA